MNRALNTVPMPPGVTRLPRNDVGYPVPWFVETLDGGVRDFRIMSAQKFLDALRFDLCWVCGQRRGRYAAFVIGPMCCVNRIAGEPPSHRDCAVYSAKVCPFLSTPNFRRRETGKPADTVPAAGNMITRNPGVALVWVTRSFTTFHPDRGQPGILIEIGDPAETLWFCQGRPATRAEVTASIESGLPLLHDACDDEDEGERAAAHAELDRQVAAAMPLIPA
jgi:hypothetical protein